MEEQPHATDTENTQQDAAQLMTDLSQPIAWQAPEGVQAHRTTGWYIAVGFVVLALMALAIFVLIAGHSRFLSCRLWRWRSYY